MYHVFAKCRELDSGRDLETVSRDFEAAKDQLSQLSQSRKWRSGRDWGASMMRVVGHTILILKMQWQAVDVGVSPYVYIYIRIHI